MAAPWGRFPLIPGKPRNVRAAATARPPISPRMGRMRPVIACQEAPKRVHPPLPYTDTEPSRRLRMARARELAL